jgi:hypothetical protein
MFLSLSNKEQYLKIDKENWSMLGLVMVGSSTAVEPD